MCEYIPPLHFKVFYLRYCTVRMATHFVHPTLPPTQHAAVFVSEPFKYLQLAIFRVLDCEILGT